MKKIFMKNISVMLLKERKFKITVATGILGVNVTFGYNFYNEKIKWYKIPNIGDSAAIFLIVEPK